ncbi:MAG: radical SAM protein [bacterium]
MKTSTLKDILYIYNPVHNEDSTVDDIMEIDSLVPFYSERMVISVRYWSLGVWWTTKTQVPFRSKYVLADIIPRSLWPKSYRKRRSVQIRLSIEADKEVYTSQRLYLNLVREKELSPETTGRSYCSLPWTRLLLGYSIATPCYSTIRKFHVPAHFETGYDPWNGGTMVQLRQSLIRGQSKYCSPNCLYYSTDKPQEIYTKFKGDSLIRRNIDEVNQEYLDGETSLFGKPAVLGVYMGTGCNNYCRFCSIHSVKPFSIRGQILELAKYYAPYAKRIDFTGGEPLIYVKKIREILADYPQQEGKVVKFMTNGILVKERMDFLRTIPHLCLSINLNTPSPKAYARLHGIDGFQNILEGIELVKRERAGLQTNIQIKMIVMRSTYRRIREFSRLAAELGVNSVVFSDLRFDRRVAFYLYEKLAQGMPGYDEARAAVVEARQFLVSHGVRVAGTFSACG